MDAEVRTPLEKSEDSALSVSDSSFAREKADILQAAQVMFEQVLTRWAGDWLHLLACRLDRPVTEGRVTTIQRVENLEISPERPIPATTAYRRSTIERVRRRVG